MIGRFPEKELEQIAIASKTALKAKKITESNVPLKQSPKAFQLKTSNN